MEWIVIGFVAMYFIIKYSKSIKHSADALDSKAYAWSADIKLGAVQDIANLRVDEEVVERANNNISALNKLSL